MRTELALQLRRRRTAVGLIGLALVPVLLAVALVTTDGGGGGGPDGGGDPTGLFSLAEASALNFTLTSLAAVAPFLLLAVVALFTGDTVSGEAGWGSLRYTLTRPVPRWQVLTRKLAVGLLLSVVAVVVVAASATASGAIAFGWGGVTTPFGQLGAGETLLRLVVIAGYVLWSSLWVACLAFALSTTTDQPVGAVAGTIVIVIVMQILDAIPALGALRDYLPVHETQAWVALLAEPPRWAALERGMWLQVPYAVILLAAGWYWFHRKDVLS